MKLANFLSPIFMLETPKPLLSSYFDDFSVFWYVVYNIFNIPEYVVLLDAVPGRINTVWFSPTEVGEFDIQCREYCGLIHYNMRATLFVEGA